MNKFNLYCICGEIFDIEEGDNFYFLQCPSCGRTDKIKKQQKTIELTINKETIENEQKRIN